MAVAAAATVTWWSPPGAGSLVATTPTSPGHAASGRELIEAQPKGLTTHPFPLILCLQVVEMLRKGAGEFNLVVISGRQVQDHINHSK